MKNINNLNFSCNKGTNIVVLHINQLWRIFRDHNTFTMYCQPLNICVFNSKVLGGTRMFWTFSHELSQPSLRHQKSWQSPTSCLQLESYSYDIPLMTIPSCKSILNSCRCIPKLNFIIFFAMGHFDWPFTKKTWFFYTP